MMKARDVMTSPAITVSETALLVDAAKQLMERRISALPVVDTVGKLVGIISEADMVHREEIGTDKQSLSWLTLLAEESTSLAGDYIKAHSRYVSDVMTRKVITATPDTPLAEIALAMEQNNIRCIPIICRGRVLGIVSRANLVQAIARGGVTLRIPLSDVAIRETLLTYLREQPWAHTDYVNVSIKQGIVDLSGMTKSATERDALRVAAECIPGVRAVNDRMLLPGRAAELSNHTVTMK